MFLYIKFKIALNNQKGNMEQHGGYHCTGELIISQQENGCHFQKLIATH